MSDSTDGGGKWVPPHKRVGFKPAETTAPTTTEEKFRAWLAGVPDLTGVTVLFIGRFQTDNYRFKLNHEFEQKQVCFNVHYDKGPFGGERRFGGAWVPGITGMSVTEFAGSNFLLDLVPAKAADLVANKTYG